MKNLALVALLACSQALAQSSGPEANSDRGIPRLLSPKERPVLDSCGEEAVDSILEKQGLYRLFGYCNRSRIIDSMLKIREFWRQGAVLPSEEIEWLPKWQEAYRWQKSDKLLLVNDDDGLIYAARTDRFETVGYIKKKGKIKRIAEGAWKVIKVGADGPAHIILSVFGF